MIPTTVFVAIGAITAAVLTGIFTFVSLVISKEQKTTEFRQQWINELRSELTEFTSSVGTFLSYIIYLNSAYKNKELSLKYSEFIKDNIELTTSITKHYDSIRLRVNPKKDKVFLQNLHALKSIAASKTIPNSVEEVTIINEKLMEESQELLKKEWIRVKRGELSFFITKWLMAISVILILIGTSYYHEILFEYLISISTDK